MRQLLRHLGGRAVLGWAGRRGGGGRVRVALVGTVVCAAALLIAGDLHGVSLTAGVALMVVPVTIEHLTGRSASTPAS